MSKLWTAQVSQIGADAGEMIEAGVLILFGDPVPEALTEYLALKAESLT